MVTTNEPDEKSIEAPGVTLETLKQFTDSFGDKANGYLLSGLSFDQANLKFKDDRISALEAENKTLKDKAFTITESAKEAAEVTKQMADKLLGEVKPVETPATGAT